jgi:hypothetical protein
MRCRSLLSQKSDTNIARSVDFWRKIGISTLMSQRRPGPFILDGVADETNPKW